MKKISDATVERLKQISPDTLVAHGIIKTAPNFSERYPNRGLCCPLCGSGERGGTGAATFDANNRLFCHACQNEANGGHKLSAIDLFAIARNLQHESFGEVCRQMCAEFGEELEEEKFDAPRRFKRHAQTASPKKKQEPENPALIELIRKDLQTSDEPLIKFVESCGGKWRGLPIDILIRHGFKFVADWTPPKSRVEKKKYTPTERILIPSSENFYVARFCGNLDDYDGTTRKFVEDTQKLNAGKPTIFNADVLDSDKPIFCLEGSIDAVTLELAGFDAVALNSAANDDLLVNELAKKKKKPRVVILLDADEQGRKTAPKLYAELINIGVPCCVRYLFDETTKTDANDILIRDGEENLRERLESIMDSSLAELDAVAKELEERRLHRHDDALIDFLFQGNSSDLAFARRLEKFCGDSVRWMTDDKSWLIYKPNEYGGGLWTDAGEQNSCLLPHARKMAELMLENAENKDERELAEKFTSAKKISQGVTMMKSLDELLITADDLDRHSELICCLNGVVNLQTGKLMQADAKTFMMTQTAAAIFGTPRKESVDFVQKFLRDIQPDETTRRGLLRWLGYCLTGETSAEKFMVWIGGGANGKGTLSKMVLSLFGGYGVGLAPRALLKSNRPVDADKATTGLNGLVGKRFAISEEMPLDGEIDGSLIKNLTGSDKINLRKNFKEYVTLENFAKINISGNYTPRIENAYDGGIRRRLLNMPFTQTFGTDENPADLTLKKRLLEQDNLDALFFILVAEAVNWYRGGGLIISDLMTQATEKHLNDSDFVADFLSEYYEFGDGLSVKAKDLIDELKDKCPAECRPFRKRADLINLVAQVDGVTYGEDRKRFKVFNGIGKPKQDNAKDEFDGEILSSADFIPPN